MSFNIMGQVDKPGYFPLTHPSRCWMPSRCAAVSAISPSRRRSIFLRTAPDGKQEKLHFNYKEVIKGKNMAQNIMSQPRDTIVVP